MPQARNTNIPTSMPPDTDTEVLLYARPWSRTGRLGLRYGREGYKETVGVLVTSRRTWARRRREG